MSNILDDTRMGEGDGGFSNHGIQHIQKVGTWTKITSICGFIILGLLALLLVFLMATAGGMLFSAPQGMVIVVVLFLVIGFGGFMLYLLMQYANKCTAFTKDRTPATYAAATGTRKVFWIIAGILSILSVLSSLMQIVTLMGQLS